MSLSFNEYQSATEQTAIYPKDRELEYLALGLASEAGEVAGKIKKVIRDDDGVMSDAKAYEVRKELGGCLWYIARLSQYLNFQLEDVADENIDILLSRQARGVLGGSGDNR